jgi:hypothetical protein
MKLLLLASLFFTSACGTTQYSALDRARLNASIQQGLGQWLHRENIHSERRSREIMGNEQVIRFSTPKKPVQNPNRYLIRYPAQNVFGGF